MAREPKYELKKPRNDPSMKVKETNLPAKKYKHSNPTELRLCFEVDATQNYAWIDLAQCLSIVNRKAYRQHAYYYVQKMSLYDNETNFVDVNVAPDTYVTRNAVVRGKAIWDDMNERVAGKVGGFIPKFHDYKVYLEARQKDSDNLVPYGYSVETSVLAAPLPAGEWIYSEYVSADSNRNTSADPDAFTVHILGDDTTSSRGLIRSYALTRRLPQQEEPRVPGQLETDDLLNVMDYSDEEQVNEILNHLDLHNDDHPYSQDFYIGSDDFTVPNIGTFANQYQHVARLATVQDSNRVATIGGFCAPFGLIALDLSGITNDARIVIELAPGTYHGVYAERV